MGGGRQEDNPLQHELLEAVAAAGLVYRVDTFGVVDILHQLPQLARRIPGKPGKARLLPETGKNVQLAHVGKVVAVVVTVSVSAASDGPGSIWRHVMDAFW